MYIHIYIHIYIYIYWGVRAICSIVRARASTVRARIACWCASISARIIHIYIYIYLYIYIYIYIYIITCVYLCAHLCVVYVIPFGSEDIRANLCLTRAVARVRACQRARAGRGPLSPRTRPGLRVACRNLPAVERRQLPGLLGPDNGAAAATKLEEGKRAARLACAKCDAALPLVTPRTLAAWNLRASSAVVFAYSPVLTRWPVALLSSHIRLS